MKVLYHYYAPLPRLENTEAVFQEITALRNRFAGEINTLNPLPHGTYLSWRLYGLHQLPFLLGMDRRIDIHHVFSASLLPYPVMRLWRKPIIYSVVAGLNQKLPAPDRFPAGTIITVSNERDERRLQEHGYRPVVIRPAIETARFFYQAAPTSPVFTMLAGSAPWGLEQFASKGIDALLEVTRKDSRLRLILLWRGLLYDELVQRIHRAGLQDRVEIINERVDVNQMLARVNATAVLAASPEVVKAWPHSLMESLAAGKPVLLSQTIPMSDYVTQHQCGVVIPDHSIQSLETGLNQLINDYQLYQASARQSGQRDFNLELFLNVYARTYEQVYR
jgi:glycosyltransferase involved in cell wall biosynthesis